MTKKILNHSLTILLIISILVLILTISIGLPIYFRPFYYLHINALELPLDTGYSYDTIKDAYDKVLDFLVFGKEFSTGALKYSEEGKNHFIDCKFLFDLNLWGLIISLVISITILVLNKKKIIEIQKYFGFSPAFFSSCFINITIIIVGLLAATDFDKAFEIFHKIFFPGKDNWLFNPRTDQIINVLPQEFFRNCAILIASSVIIITFFFIIKEIINKKKQKSIKQ